MSEHADENEATCCACTGIPIALVVDGAYRKPVCESHGRMYRQQGYRIVNGPVEADEVGDLWVRDAVAPGGWARVTPPDVSPDA